MKSNEDTKQDAPMYGKASPTGLLGYIFQIKLSMLFLKRALDHGMTFRLGTEVTEADKFDDLVFRYEEGEEVRYKLCQAKYKGKGTETLDYQNLFKGSDGDFSLEKYFWCFCNIRYGKFFSDGTLEDLVLCTNANLDEKSLTFKGVSVHCIEETDKILDLQGSVSYKLGLTEDYEKKKGDFRKRLKDNQELKELVRKLVEAARGIKILDFGRDCSLGKYKVAVFNDVIDRETGGLKKTFVEGRELPRPAAELRSILIQELSLDENDDLRNALSRIRLEGNFKGPVFTNFNSKSQKLTATEAVATSLAHVVYNSVDNRAKLGTGNWLLYENIDELRDHVFEANDDGKWVFKKALLADDKELEGELGVIKKRLLEKKKRNGLESIVFDIEVGSSPERSLPFSVKDEDINEFFRIFRLMVNMPSEARLGEIMREEQGENCLNLIEDSPLYSSIESELTKWLTTPERQWITSRDNVIEEMDGRVMSYVGAVITQNYTTNLKRYGVLIRDTQGLLDGLDKRSVLIIKSSNTTVTSLVVHNNITDVDKKFSHISTDLGALNSENTAKVVQKSFCSLAGPTLLILECGQTLDSPTHRGALNELPDILTEIILNIKNNPNQKIIFSKKRILFIVSTDMCDLLEDFMDEEDIDYTSRTDEGIKLQSLESESRKTIMKREILFQGRSVALGEIGDGSLVKNLDKEKLAKLVLKQEVSICNELSIPEIPKGTYIKRSLKHPSIIRKDVLQRKENFVLAIFGSSVDDLKDLGAPSSFIAQHSEVDWEAGCNAKFVILDQHQYRDQFKVMCRCTNNLHLIEVKEGILKWHSSFGEVDGLKKYLDAKDVEVDEERLIDNQEGIVLVSDVAGMGKSMLLNNLALTLKEKSPGKLVIKFDLNDYTGFLQSKQKEMRPNNLESWADFLTKMLLAKIRKLSESEKKWFRRSLTTQRACLLFDGVDEIAPDYTELVLALVQGLRVGHDLWLSTRPHIHQELEGRLGTLAYTIQPFKKEDQVRYLSNNWGLEDSVSRAEKLVDKLSSSTRDVGQTFCGIPLQCRMLAQVYHNPQIPIPQKLDLFDLYTKFVDEKISIFVEEKNEVIRSKPGMKDFVRNTTEKVKRGCMILGTMHLYRAYTNSEFIRGISEEAEDSRHVVDPRSGILIGYTEEGQPQFIHRTFAEFFASAYILERMTHPEDDQYRAAVLFFLNPILFQPIESYVRRFLDWHFKATTLQKDVIKKCSKLMIDDYLCRLDPHYLFYPIEDGDQNIIRFIINCLDCDISVTEKMVNATPQFVNRDILEFRNPNIFELTKESYTVTSQFYPDESPQECTILEWACKHGNEEVVEWLLNHGARVRKICDGRSLPLELAAREGHTKVVGLLLDHGVEPETRAMFRAAEKKKWNTVDFLLNKGADPEADKFKKMAHLRNMVKDPALRSATD